MALLSTLEIGAAYIRVSSDEQTELSPDAQVRVIKDAAKADGYYIPDEFIFMEERGISGRKAENRPAFQRMIAVAKSENPAPFKRLYLWKFSRFARNQEESTFYKGILRKKCGVEIKSVSEPIAEGMFGRLIETIIEWFDEYYSINLSGEVLRGMTEKALRNGYQTAPSMGYAAVGHGNPFVIDPERMKIVEQIHTLYHNGMDMTGIARELNRLGYLTQRGTAFERRTIYRILTNKFYIGTVTWNNISFQGTHALSPVVTEVFEDNQARIKRESQTIKHRDVSSCKHWLSGLLRCGICGSTLSYSRSNNPKQRSDTFQCWKYIKGMHPGSNSISVRKVEQAVFKSLKEVLLTKEINYEYIPPQDSEVIDQKALLKEAIEKVAVKERRIRDAYENGIDTLEEYKENKKRLLMERTELTEELEKLCSCSPADAEAGKEELLQRIQTVCETLSDPDIDFEAKGVAIRRVIKYIVYNKANNTLQFYYYLS